MSVLEGLAQIRSAMDKYVVGHDDVKEAIMLGLIAREHIYLEGPPGTAKTMLAEIISEAADLVFFFYQLHRDTRLAELVGDTVIFRERDDSGGEIIRQANRKGGILTSEICVLDDISRSPGEALNVLLRVLNERKFGGESIPLLTAIATGNPTKDDYYNEPLDPANLDRFTIQMRTLGLVQQNKWQNAAQVIDLYAASSTTERITDKVERAVLDEANSVLPTVDLTAELKQLLLDFLSLLLNDYGLDDNNSLLTDRTFLVKAVKILKAKAVLEGRDRCVPEDLFVLKYLTTFRIPEELHNRIEDIISDLLRKKKVVSEETEDIEQMSQAQAEESDEGEPSTDYSAQEAAVDHRKQQLELGDMMQQTLSPNAENGGDDTEMNLDRESIENIEVLLKVLKGRIERNRAEKVPHRGGQPRKYRRLISFDDLDDTDPVESAIWYDNVSPLLPRMLLRERFDRGGELAILRDISSSMAGVYSKWASSVILRLVELARKKRMRVGYIEFNHLSTKYQVDGKFFVRDYEKVAHRALNLHCSGCTNYQNSLEDALLEFQRFGRGNQHILFLTDGVPTQGDWEVKAERELAKQLGVAIHTIFIGKNKCPRILEMISEETNGAQFQASTDRYGVIRIEERNRSEFKLAAGDKVWG
ncbi:MAG: AAA family ATPase [bacterium]|nr:AAA family ATPase [bacterium]